jgi:type I restriction enzyme S subunit
VSVSFKTRQLGEIGKFQAGVGFPVKLQGKAIGKYPFAKVGDISRFARAGVVEIDGASNYVDEDDLEALGTLPIPKFEFRRFESDRIRKR